LIQMASICRKEMALKLKRRYLVAVALLAVLAVMFGLAGTVAPMSQPVMPQQESSESVTHFTYPPTFDSGWVNITNMWGQDFTLTHDLNTTNVVVGVVGKESETGGEHQTNLGGTGWIPGWNRTWGGPSSYDHDLAYSVIQTVDEGYAMVGTRENEGSSGKSVWLVKTDWAGHVQWNSTYSEGGTDEEAFAIIQTTDGGYAVAGYTDRGTGDDDFWWFKTDAFGNQEWSRLLLRSQDDYAYSIIETSDGGYVVAGEFYHQSALIKTTPTGTPLAGWPKTYDGEYVRSVVQTVDGGYALAGSKMQGGKLDFWLVKVDSGGTEEWMSSKTYGGSQHDEAYSVVQTVDGGYALAGYTRSYGAGHSDFWLVKTSHDGTEEWSRTYGGAQYDGVIMYYDYYPFACTVVQTVDGGYALAGPTESYGAGHSDFWLVKTNSTGNVQWNTTFGGDRYDWAYSMVYTRDGRHMIGGSTFVQIHGGDDKADEFWLVKSSIESGLAWTDLTNTTITLHRGATDSHWNYVRVRIWTIQEPTWQFGDINQDGVVDAQDLLILSQHYGWPLSLLSLGGIVGILGVQTYKSRKRPE